MMADEGRFDRSTEYEQYAGETSFIDSNEVLTEFKEKGLVGDKYVDMQEIARGGMGIIYQVKDIGLDRTTVLKIINPELISNSDLLTRFIEEARITGQLEHPNIVPVHDVGVLGGDQIYFSMKKIEGCELRGIMDQLATIDSENAPYSTFALLTIFRKVCNAVSYAHSKGIIHRDVKPDNVLVGDFGEVLLVDWGLARRLDQEEEEIVYDQGFFDSEMSGSVTRTRYGVIKGTPAYMAPEMASGDVENVGIRSDVFLLGATLYAITTLKAPFTDDGPDDIYEILHRAEMCQFVKPSDRAPDRLIAPELERIIMKAMAFQPERRYQTVQELIDDVDALMEGRAESEQSVFRAGEHLMNEGDHGDRAFVIISGKVEVFKEINGVKTLLVQLGPGSVVGEMALIDNSPRSASVIASTDTEVSVITRHTLKDTMNKMPPWFGRTVSTLSARLRKTNSDIHPLLKNDPIYHVMNAFRLIYPFCGQPADHPQTGESVIVLKAERVLLETSTMLSLPAEIVFDAMTRIMRTNLIVAISEDYFYMPNFNLFTSFVNFVGLQLGHPCGIPNERFADFFDSDGLLTMTFSNADIFVTGDNAYDVTDPYEILGCAPNEIDSAFADLFELLSLPADV